MLVAAEQPDEAAHGRLATLIGTSAPDAGGRLAALRSEPSRPTLIDDEIKKA